MGGFVNNIRRCLGCLAKTHKMYWIDEKCPVCEMSVGYKESGHGGLNLDQINELREQRTELEERAIVPHSPERGV